MLLGSSSNEKWEDAVQEKPIDMQPQSTSVSKKDWESNEWSGIKISSSQEAMNQSQTRSQRKERNSSRFHSAMSPTRLTITCIFVISLLYLSEGYRKGDHVPTRMRTKVGDRVRANLFHFVSHPWQYPGEWSPLDSTITPIFRGDKRRSQMPMFHASATIEEDIKLHSLFFSTFQFSHSQSIEIQWRQASLTLVYFPESTLPASRRSEVRAGILLSLLIVLQWLFIQMRALELIFEYRGDDIVDVDYRPHRTAPIHAISLFLTHQTLIESIRIMFYFSSNGKNVVRKISPSALPSSSPSRLSSRCSLSSILSFLGWFSSARVRTDLHLPPLTLLSALLPHRPSSPLVLLEILHGLRIHVWVRKYCWDVTLIDLIACISEYCLVGEWGGDRERG